MYKSFYAMSTNPFLKDESINYKYESNDFKETINRFNFLKEVKGIGLFIGESGLGKTYAVRYFINNLNKDLFKIIYINPSPKMSVFDFYKSISNKLGLDVGACYKNDICENIQKEIKRLVIQDRINPIVIIDDAHLLSREILNNFKILYDFDMDSKDYITLILLGHSELKVELSKKVHETIKQRIIANYTFKGLSREEVKEYVSTRLKIANSNNSIFDETALNSLYSCCKSSIRRLNMLVTNSLILGCQNKKPIIDSDIVMSAKNEMDIS